ncbi:MAG: hypothetical protein AAGA77_01635 [Bacteroidota bacterium]
MPDFNPNEMDALFREGAERHEFEYNPDAWALMEEKLDQSDRRRRIGFFILGLLLIAFVAGTYVYLNSNERNSLSEVAASEQSLETLELVDNKSNNASEKALPTQDISDALGSQKTIDDTTISNEYIATDSKESRSNIGAQNSFQTENTGNLMGNEIVSINSETKTPEAEKVALENKSKQEKTVNEIPSPQIPVVENQEKDVLLIPFLRTKALESFQAKQNLPDGSALEIAQTTVSPISFNTGNRFALTLFANPEWSSVGLFNESKTGWSLGTRFGYQFSNNFELSAGIAYSRKIYKGAGAEYTMDGGWNQDVEPMSMDAKCGVIEIPLTLAYYVNGYRNSGFFADLGISSYMMHSEWYGFEYDALTAPPNRIEEVIEQDENTHLVGVGRLAIGYQKVLSVKTSLQVEPYLQFPLTGIGAGLVNVYSSGVQVAVKFNTQ